MLSLHQQQASVPCVALNRGISPCWMAVPVSSESFAASTAPAVLSHRVTFWPAQVLTCTAACIKCCHQAILCRHQEARWTAWVPRQSLDISRHSPLQGSSGWATHINLHTHTHTRTHHCTGKASQALLQVLPLAADTAPAPGLAACSCYTLHIPLLLATCQWAHQQLQGKQSPHQHLVTPLPNLLTQLNHVPSQSRSLLHCKCTACTAHSPSKLSCQSCQ